MGYFNYFIKCLIRNFAYQASKPKVWVTVLLAIVVLFGLKHYGFCSDMQLETIIDQLAVVTENQAIVCEELSYVGADVSSLKSSLTQIQNQLSAVQNNQATIATQINDLYKQIETLNTNILNIYNTLEENQKELITELQTENQKILNELEEIKNALLTSPESNSVSSYFNGWPWFDKALSNSSGIFNVVSYNDSSAVSTAGVLKIDYNFKKGLNYIITTSNTTITSAMYYTFDTFVVGKQVYLNYVGQGNASQLSFTFKPNTDYSSIYLCFKSNAQSFADNKWIISVSSSSSISGINDNINHQNQLQQEQNQLQQEQNDFLKDDNVSADSSTLPTDTTEDITSDGFNNIFNQLYTTFTSGSAKDVVITIPFTNKSFIINSSTVYGGANLGFIKTLIEMFWYFVISYFIVQDVGNKINKIKSGDIEHVQDNNIKEDLL